MSTADEVPEDVRAFLTQHVESYEQLQILLLLQRERTDWTAQGLSERMKVSLPLIAAALASLQSRAVVECGPASCGAPDTGDSPAAALDKTIERLASVYADRPIAVIRLMSANAIERVRTAALRTFVDAFILRKLRKGNDRG